MKILTIIITYNAIPWIEKNIKSVQNSSVATDIIIIDNGSTDGTQEYITSAFPHIRFIQNAENQGFGAANNIGLRIALSENYDYAYLLNQDAYLFPDTLEHLLKYASSQTTQTLQYDILSPLQLNADGQLDPQFKKHCARYLENQKVVEVPFVMAAHWLLSRKAIATVGGFSPTFQQYGEDDNYLHRLHYHKMRCAIVPDSRAIHDRGTRPSSKERKMRLKCVATIVKASNPNKIFIFTVTREILELIAMSIKNLSLIPVKFIPKFISEIPQIRKNRKLSFEKAAFL